ncbi:polyribonucleotide nucleotidyltransferase [Candidatus Microgenomates bacterium]|nr:polyribonucleotide nucleotidyltransferase [Candidatus Microgenomates bacterium]
MKYLEESIDLNGQKLTLQFGKVAKASHVSVFARLGDTCILVTLNVAKAKEDIDYLPLQIEYAEKLYAGGRIKGSRWVKREGRPSDEAILTARLIDRGVRPLFPKELRKSIQIVCTLLSVDGVNSPDVLAAIAVSAAVHVSALPWNGPLSTARIGYMRDGDATQKGSYIVNPKEEEQPLSLMELVVTSTNKKVVMIETQAEELSEEIIAEGIKLAKEQNKVVIEFIEKIREQIGYPKEPVTNAVVDERITKIVREEFKKEIDALIKSKAEKEFEDKSALDGFIAQVAEKYSAENFDKGAIFKAIDYVSKQIMRENTMKTGKRVDGRGPDDIREIGVETDILPRTHGSAIFSRGDTQVLSIVTLGAPSLEQLIESPEGETAKHYIHHYFMPPYSVGEVGRIGFTTRRETGHGALAEKAVEPVLPNQKDFPYTIRVASEVLSSNGSTSMASTCGSILSLMDAGVPIKAPVAGIAIGLIYKSDDDYMLLNDIMGVEDFNGDMDFKVAGTEAGITAIQLDVKNDGLTDKMIDESLARALKARLHILAKMNAIISSPRKALSQYAPKVVVLTPPADKIGEIIGPGGRNIKHLIAMTGTEINIDQQGNVSISGTDKDKVDEAVSYIENMIKEVEVGTVYEGEVKRMLAFGAFIEILPGKEGMVHVSKMGKGFVKDPSEVVSVGDKVKVRVREIDPQGRVNLEMLDEDGNPMGGDGGGDRGGDRPRGDRPPGDRPRYGAGRPGGDRRGGGGSYSRPSYGGSRGSDRPHSDRPTDPNRRDDRRPRVSIDDDQ